jgi:hypothetical protein
MTNVYDCDFQVYAKSLRKMAGLNVDTLQAGRLRVALGGGQVHIQKASDCLDRMAMLPNILQAFKQM